MTIIRLKSNDGVIFNVQLAIAKRSLMIHTMIESLGDDDWEEPLVLSKVKSDILKKVIEYATYHKNDPLPDDNEEDEEKNTKTILFDSRKELDQISEWDKEFLKIDIDTLYDLIQAANFLEMKDLLQLTCKIASLLAKENDPHLIRSRHTFKN